MAVSHYEKFTGAPAVQVRRARGGPVERLRRWLGGTYAPYLYILPFVLFFIGVYGYPIGYAFFVSLHHWSGIGRMRFLGTDNYSFVLSDNYWWGAVQNTAVLWLLTVPIGIALSLAVALAWSRMGRRRLYVSRLLFLLPTTLSLVAVSATFRILYDQNYGAINSLLGVAGLPKVGWLTDENWSKPAIAIVRLWEATGLFALFLAAALQNISQEIFDAAAVDGCTPLRRFWHITLPLLGRTILFLLVIQTLGVMGIFIEPSLITSGGPGTSTTTIGVYLYALITSLDLGTASAVAFLMTGMLLLIAAVMFVAARTWQFD